MRARMDAMYARTCHYDIQKMQAIIALNTLVIEKGDQDLLIATAKPICLADLQRECAEIAKKEMPKVTEDRRQERIGVLETEVKKLTQELSSLEQSKLPP